MTGRRRESRLRAVEALPPGGGAELGGEVCARGGGDSGEEDGGQEAAGQAAAGDRAERGAAGGAADGEGGGVAPEALEHEVGDLVRTATASFHVQEQRYLCAAGGGRPEAVDHHARYRYVQSDRHFSPECSLQLGHCATSTLTHQGLHIFADIKGKGQWRRSAAKSSS
eukprot:CAMPEP_0172153964 /NCGR_PEP_ID=MMETSP1050-20130122/1755_1 /TAXON_ID=233186 /ORGANISM="Cryptomonas curvata, Strain CCAP979/52" /LENGTH=167 /DNA_ID=CAMNT_0012822595 /DNA_START=8 /DNA_END=511 /DNA_ORIENTATION=-